MNIWLKRLAILAVLSFCALLLFISVSNPRSGGLVSVLAIAGIVVIIGSYAFTVLIKSMKADDKTSVHRESTEQTTRGVSQSIQNNSEPIPHTSPPNSLIWPYLP